MGAVYEACDSTTGRRAALKVLLPEWSSNQNAVGRFVMEARAVSKVRHPCLVEFLGHGAFDDGTTYILMEYIAGESLKHRLDQCRETQQLLPLRRCLEIAHDVSGALAAVHAQGIVHRDLKPANILLPEKGIAGLERAKLVDFGIAKLDAESDGHVARTTVGRFLGTALYASPEQCEMSGEVSSPSDVYSLGVTLYEMLAGKPPFWADKPGVVLAQHQFQAAPKLNEAALHLPAPVCELVHAMLTKSPQKRPTMAAVEQRLGSLLDNLDDLRSKTGNRVERIRLAVLAVALIVGGLGFMQLSQRSSRHQPPRPIDASDSQLQGSQQAPGSLIDGGTSPPRPSAPEPPKSPSPAPATRPAPQGAGLPGKQPASNHKPVNPKPSSRPNTRLSNPRPTLPTATGPALKDDPNDVVR